jgi:hypothetical protein
MLTKPDPRFPLLERHVWLQTSVKMGFDQTSFAQLLRVAERDRPNRIASDWHCATRVTQRRSATRCRFGALPEVQGIGTWGQAV